MCRCALYKPLLPFEVNLLSARLVVNEMEM